MSEQDQPGVRATDAAAGVAVTGVGGYVMYRRELGALFDALWEQEFGPHGQRLEEKHLGNLVSFFEKHAPKHVGDARRIEESLKGLAPGSVDFYNASSRAYQEVKSLVLKATPKEKLWGALSTAQKGKVFGIAAALGIATAAVLASSHKPSFSDRIATGREQGSSYIR